MNTADRPLWWRVWCLWVAGSMAGFALVAAGFRGVGTVAGGGTSALLGACAIIVAAGVGASLPGFLHWLILRQWFPRAGWWILASGVGSMLGFLLTGLGLAPADTGSGIVRERIIPTLAFCGAGATVGTLQWLVLRNWISRAGWWVLASAASWWGAAWVYALLTRGNDVNLLLGGIASGAFSGAVTASILIWLWRRSTVSQETPGTVRCS